MTEFEVTQPLTALNKVSPGYLYPMVLFFSETGCKVAELYDLKWTHVDLDHQQVNFPRREKIQARTIRLSDEIIMLLSARSQRSALVFEIYRKEPFNRYKIIQAVNEFKNKDLYSKNWTPDDLRHSFAVNFLARGESIKELQYRMGNRTNQHTKDLYSVLVKATEQKFIHPFS